MKLRVTFAILICKLTHAVLRVLKRGGTALPGKVATGICPDLLKYLAKDVESLVITGTNGKTTSARMLEQFFIESGLSYFSNKSGSNLMRGIAAEYALNAGLSGKPKRKYAIIECDEAACRKVFEYMAPKVILITNIFRDQTNRFKDVGQTLEHIKTGVKNAPNACICLNADDSLTSSIADEVPNKAVFFGINTQIYKNRTEERSDAPKCIRCGTEYDYSYVTFGHLGGFSCPSCGYARKTPDIAAEEIKAGDPDRQNIRLRAFGETYELAINIPGAYNIYNAVGAIAAAAQMGFSIDDTKTAMLNFECGFGRMEKLELNNVPVRIILVKNAAGCNQALNYLSEVPGEMLIAFCLNDRIADGTDISWIRDVRIENLFRMNDRLKGIYVSGIRADDMEKRLGEAGFTAGCVKVYKDHGEMLNTMLKQNTPIYILPTYTAMLELRDKISREFGIKRYWE